MSLGEEEEEDKVRGSKTYRDEQIFTLGRVLRENLSVEEQG